MLKIICNIYNSSTPDVLTSKSDNSSINIHASWDFFHDICWKIKVFIFSCCITLTKKIWKMYLLIHVLWLIIYAYKYIINKQKTQKNHLLIFLKHGWMVKRINALIVIGFDCYPAGAFSISSQTIWLGDKKLTTRWIKPCIVYNKSKEILHICTCRNIMLHVYNGN